MKKIILISLYVLFGLVLAAVDSYTLPVYLTLLPIHALLLHVSVKSKNIVLILYCVMLFMSHGIGSIAFYLSRETANSVGFGAIGNFDFSYGRLFHAYSYMLVFLVTLTLFVFAFKKRWHTNFLPRFIKQQYNTIQFRSARWSTFPLLASVALFLTISLWMYNMHIGMIGLQQTELPYHLTGVLFYSRRFVFPLVLIWFYIKTRDKAFGTVALIIYAYLVGVTATSKSAALLVLVPLAYLNYLIGKKGTSIFCVVSSIIIYLLVGEIRTIIFEVDANIDIMSVLSSSFDFSHGDNLFVFLLGNVTNRLYGLQATVLPDQYQAMTFEGLFSFYSGTSITEVIPDYVRTLFGFSLPEDKAYGVGLGYSGTMMLLCCHNYLYVILQAFIVAVLFSIQNSCIQKVIASEAKIVYKYVVLLLMLFAFLKFYDGNEFLSVYIITIILVILKNTIVKRRKNIRPLV